MKTIFRSFIRLFALAAILLLAAAGGTLVYMTAMPGSSHRAPLPPLSAEESDLSTRLQ